MPAEHSDEELDIRPMRMTEADRRFLEMQRAHREELTLWLLGQALLREVLEAPAGKQPTATTVHEDIHEQRKERP